MRFLPLTIRIERRAEPEEWLKAAVPVGSVGVALALSSVIFAAHGLNPLEVYSVILRSTLTRTGLAWAVVKLIPLLLCALGLVIVFRARIWNIGAEGQLLMGAVASAGLALFVMPDAPSAVLVPAMFIVGFLAGAGWALIPGVLRAKLGVNEVITTLMMNYIAVDILIYLTHGPWRGERAWGRPLTDPIPGQAVLPTVPGTYIHYPTLILALVLACAVHVLMEKTGLGYELKVFGDNPELARAAGMRPARLVIISMLLSGGLAGLAGVGELAGIHKMLNGERPWSLSSGYGYTAIIVAWLARLNPLAAVVAAFFMGALVWAGMSMQTMLDLPFASVNIFNGLILVCLVSGELLLRYRVRLIWGGGRGT